MVDSADSSLAGFEELSHSGSDKDSFFARDGSVLCSFISMGVSSGSLQETSESSRTDSAGDNTYFESYGCRASTGQATRLFG